MSADDSPAPEEAALDEEAVTFAHEESIFDAIEPGIAHPDGREALLKLVETADDIVAELGPLAGHMLQNTVESTESEAPMIGDDEEHAGLMRFLGHDPASTDELVERSGLTIDQVSSMLLILELEGKIEKLSGGRYSVLS